MKINGICKGVLVAGLLMMTMSPVLAQNNNDNPSQALQQILLQEDITYTTGGIGADETEALKATAKNYNLIIWNADKHREFTDNTTIIITNKATHKSLTVNNAGPLFYAKLLLGTYVIKATNGNEKTERIVSITGKKQVNVYFTWQDGGGL